jgi:hypothetical protein
MDETCFVIMPFGGQFDSTYKSVLVPAIGAAGYKPVRGDEVYSIRPVIEDVFQEIRTASVLVADVTGNNPNVNYELGVAHGLNKSVVIIGQGIEVAPFDIRHLRTIVYNTQSEGWAEELSNKLIATLRAQHEAARLRAANEGRKVALVGKWAGQLNQQTDGGPVSIETEMEMAMTPNGDLRGTWVLFTEPLGYSQIKHKISCTTIHEQYVKLEFESDDPAVMTFGTFMARLSANARTIDGQYVGYGSVSDRLVTGSVLFRKAPAS